MRIEMKFIKFITLTVVFLLITSVASIGSAESVTVKNSRVSFNVKDTKGKKYKVYFKGYNEETARGSYGEYCTWNCAWAGVNEKDVLYYGDYKVFLQEGTKKPKYTKVHRNGYVYNKTRKMIYYLPSKYNGQPDLFGFSDTESSNFESISLYFIKDGKLTKVKQDILYTERPHFIGKNKFEIASYDNRDGTWIISTYKFSPSKATLTKTSDKYYSFKAGNSKIKKWKRSWK